MTFADVLRAVLIAGALLLVALPIVAVWRMVRTHRKYDRWDR